MLIRIMDKSEDIPKLVKHIWELSDDFKYGVSIKVLRKQRSISQNRLYRLWLNIIAEETGFDDDFMHDFFRDLFLKRTRRTIKGEKRSYTRILKMSTTSLDTKQMYWYMEKIRMWCIEELSTDSERPFSLPNPDDRHLEELLDRYED